MALGLPLGLPARPSRGAWLLLGVLGLASLAPACSGAARSGAGRGAEVGGDALSQEAPVLPAMEAEVYAAGSGQPADTAVAVAMAGRPWDEALSGGAAAAALDGESGQLTLAGVQWAVWRAGYPFPVELVAVGVTAEKGPPTAVRGLIEDPAHAGKDIGLARARRGELDRWVGLVGRPVAGLPAFDRQYGTGEALRLDLPATAEWTLVTPEGEPTRGTGSISRTLSHEGEWWLELRLPDGALSLPLYAGMAMPKTPVMQLPGRAVAGPDDARELTATLLGELRTEFESSLLTVDPTLQTLARQPLETLLDGSWDHDAAVARMRSAGFVGDSTEQVWCRGPTVAQCLESLIRTAQGRIALLDPRHDLVGIDTRVETSGVLLLLLLASE